MATGQNKVLKQLFVNAKNGMKITPLVYQVEQMLERIDDFAKHNTDCDLSPCTCGLTALRQQFGLLDG